MRLFSFLKAIAFRLESSNFYTLSKSTALGSGNKSIKQENDGKKLRGRCEK